MQKVSWLRGILWLILIPLSCDLQPGQTEDPLDKIMQGFQLQDETILDALARINAATGLSVSVELILKDNLSDHEVEYPRLNSLVNGGQTKKILDAICALDARFTWSRYKNTINVYPRRSIGAGDKYFMNRRLAHIEIKESLDPAQAVFQTVSRLPGPLEQIAFMQTGGEVGFPRPWNLSLNGVTVRQAFDEIAEHLGKGYGWTLSGAKNFRVIRFHARLITEPEPQLKQKR